MSDLQNIADSARQAIDVASDANALDAVRVQYLGKKGELTALLKGLKDLPNEQRPTAGAEINNVKARLQEAISLRKDVLEDEAVNKQLVSEANRGSMPLLRHVPWSDQRGEH